MIPKLHSLTVDAISDLTAGHLVASSVMNSMAMQQEPRTCLEVPIPYIFGLCLREYPHKIWPYMVQYLQFRILEFPLMNRSGRKAVPKCAKILPTWEENIQQMPNCLGNPTKNGWKTTCLVPIYRS